MRVHEAAIEVLIETRNPGVMYGDEWLCHQIAAKLRWAHEGPRTSRRVLAALAKTPGRMVKGLVRMPSDCCARGQAVLSFNLPEPEYRKVMDALNSNQCG